MKASSAKSARLLLLVFWISMLPLISGCGLFERDSVFGGLSGVVLDKETGKPIEGAVVFIHWQLERVKFEISPGPTAYWSETTTDKDGRFKFDDSLPVPVKFSLQLRVRESAPTIGVSKDGYGFYITSTSHMESGVFQRKYQPTKKQREINLVKRTVGEILSGDSMTFLFMRVLEEIVNPYQCDPTRMAKTIAQLEILMAKAAKYNRKNKGSYSVIYSFLKSRRC